MIRLANTPMPHVTCMAQSVLDVFRAKTMLNNMHRPIPSPEPDPEPNPGPDAARQNGQARKAAMPISPVVHGSISPADWDELFRAVQVRLAHCVSDAVPQAPELPLHDQRAVTQAVVLDCVEALKHLHAALVSERAAGELKLQQLQQAQRLQQAYPQHQPHQEH
jgi:hypothetical protein